jgi:acetolactate synthase-1/2/3 large subunit
VVGKIDSFCPNATIIHIDIDPASISKSVEVDVPIVGDVATVLRDMTSLIKESKNKPDQKALDAWWAKINEWRGLNCLRYDRNSDKIKPQYVIEKLYEVTEGDAYITSDVGQHQMWAAQFYKFNEPRRWINSGGLGTMGFGMPAAIGVQLAHPDATVACITGDASIQMCIQELSTALQYSTPIKIISLNNRYMGMVRQWQEFFYDSRYSHSYMETIPDFVKLAEAYGHVGMSIEKPADVELALKEAFAAKDRLVFMDFVTDQKENVYPMIAQGKGHHEMHLSPERELA